MRIAYMLTSLGMGGAERQVVVLAERMAKRGHSVALIVLMPRAAEEWPTTLDVHYLDMRKTPRSLFDGLMGARRFLRAFHPDLVHSHTFHANLAARMLRLAGAAPATLSTIHNVYEGGRLRMLAYRVTDSLAVRTTAVSEAAARRYVQLKAVPQHKCTLLTNGIDLAEFTPDPERCQRMRAELGVSTAFLWLAAGRIVPAKDLPNMLRAFAQVRAANQSAQLWIAGDAMAAEFDRATALSAELGLYPAVRWLGLRRDIPALLDAADGFVLSSAWEGMPLALGEAMTMAKPVVATDVGGVRELVGTAGRIVPAKDSAALAEAMLAIMRQSTEERAALGRAAHERIAQHFSMETRIDEWEQLYRSVLAAQP
jgi:glycosyltransferase involved in cell wall biosynthesis